ncbi:MAG: AAA family ATPase [Actinomycetia bacterium]|nr:AAA family ATPase [Actinomycetes bacterium]
MTDTSPPPAGSPPSELGAQSDDTAGPSEADELRGGSYELLRRRLASQARQLVSGAEAVDSRRIATFSSSRLKLVGSDRLSTDVIGQARDIVRIGDLLLFGYNVGLDLASVEPEHVFALYRAGGAGGRPHPELVPVDPSDPAYFLGDPVFREEFAKLYRFYGKARFIDLRASTTQLLAVFQVGDRISDVVVLRWAVADDGSVAFIDSRGDRDYTWPPAHDFMWTVCGREDQRAGAHPTVVVDNEVFVGFRNGRLQLRTEDGSPGGRVVVDEEVEAPGQSLADVEVAWFGLGDVLLLRVSLYGEAERFYVFGRRSGSGTRVDAIGAACRILPGEDGVVFPGGYHLASTGTRVFEVDAQEMVFEEAVVSPNGEDVLYVFHRPENGDYLLLPYNLVRKEITQVIPCHGFGAFGDGSMVLFRGGPDDSAAARAHPVQWWETPFTDPDIEQVVGDDRWIVTVGNPTLVRGLADVYDLGRLIDQAESSERTWEAIIVAARRALDTHLWFGDDEAGGLHDQLRGLLGTAGQIVDEYARVRRLRGEAVRRTDEARMGIRRTIDSAGQAGEPGAVVSALGELQRARGETSLLSDVPEVSDADVSALIDELDGALAQLADRAVSVLDSDTAFARFTDQLDLLVTEGTAAPTTAEVDSVGERLTTLRTDLGAVVDAVTSLDAGDPTVRTRIVRRVADTTAAANRAQAVLAGHRRGLSESESAEAFDAELALVEQTLAGVVVSLETPEDCDAELARLLVNVERIEARYADDPERVASVAEQRERVAEIIGNRRTELADARARRAARITEAANRLLATIGRRAAEVDDDAAVAGFFAADQMVSRVRSLADDLDELGERGLAQEIRAELAATAEEAARQVRDRKALTADDGSIDFGGFRFAPNHQPFDVVLSPAGDGRIGAAVTGTEYRADVTERLGEFADLLDQSVPSETPTIYRGEYLAWVVMAEAEKADGVAELISRAAAPDRMVDHCRAAAERRHLDGYQRGVHDDDAARILSSVLPHSAAEPRLRHPGWVRAQARMWLAELGPDHVDQLAARIGGACTARQRLGASGPLDDVVAALQADAPRSAPWYPGDGHWSAVLGYLVDQFEDGPVPLVAASTARTLVTRLNERLGREGVADLEASMTGSPDPLAAARAWVAAYVEGDGSPESLALDIDEAAGLLAAPHVETVDATHPGAIAITGLAGDHPRIEGGQLLVRLDELAERVGRHHRTMEDRWPRYAEARRRVIAEVRAQVDVDEHRPRVMAGFVRNRLIDEALLPLVGANLGRQLGTVDQTELARSGLMVMISPPGYGKTTLMSWVADRLGLLMVKVNGPALGQDTTSLDPAAAPNAAARAEVEKINLAFRFGRNVMLFLDDVQYTAPELLSRFIPLADATRRIEGVIDGEPTTFDLRGKRFCVVMAGNPYTTGGRFELPDMLVNRSDVHNLGDVADSHRVAFELSYLENSLTACPTLAPHAAKLADDIELVLAMADGRRAVASDGLNHRWDSSELGDAVRTIRHLRRAQEVLLLVNESYVRSAAMRDEDRIVPPFLLQGSYRNMARLASRIVPVMTDDELDVAVDEHYRAEAQTLTEKAEENLLALAAKRDRLADADQVRWDAITERWAGMAAAADPAGRIAEAIDRLAGRMESDTR